MQFKLSVQFLALLPLVQLVSAGYEQCGGGKNLLHIEKKLLKIRQ